MFAGLPIQRWVFWKIIFLFFDRQRIMNSFSLAQNRTLWSTLFTKQKFNILLFKVQGHNRKTFIPNQVNCFNFWYRAHLKRPTSEYLIWSIADMIMLRTMQLGDTILCSTFIRQTKMEIVQTACRKTIYDHLWRLFKYKVSFKGFCTRKLPQFSAIAASSSLILQSNHDIWKLFQQKLKINFPLPCVLNYTEINQNTSKHSWKKYGHYYKDHKQWLILRVYFLD